jgi:streptogramin lyase
LLSGSNVFILATRSSGSSFFLRLNPDTRKEQPYYTLKHGPAPFAGMSATPDGQSLIFAELGRAESNITLVDHFE